MRPVLVASKMYKHYSGQCTLSLTTTTERKQQNQVVSSTVPVTERWDGEHGRWSRKTYDWRFFIRQPSIDVKLRAGINI